MSSGRMRYRYNDRLTNSTRVLVQEEVFHLRNWSDDGYVGQSTISMSAPTFGAAYAAQDYSARFFENDGKPSGLLTGGVFQTEEEEEEFIEKWQKWQTGRNRHRTAMMPPGMDYKPISISPKDMLVLDARKFSRIEICSIFGVPPHLLGETEKAATYASVEQFNIMFATQCLLPRLVMWEQAIQRDLILDSDVYPKFAMGALLRGDTASRYLAYQMAIQCGWMSQNEVRELEDLNPIEDGDNYWRPLNWATLGSTGVPAIGAGATPNDADNGTDPAAAMLQTNLAILQAIKAHGAIR
jgi:HK97 family phage portal protein